MPDACSISAAVKSLAETWRPVDLAAINDSVVRLVRLEGEFSWHHHDEDEAFICWSGKFRVELRGGRSVALNAGDLYVVPAGVEHRPLADSPAYALLIERRKTRQYGN